MEQFEAIPKRWGNSLGITIPAGIIKKENIKPKKKITVLVMGDQQRMLKKIYGSLKNTTNKTVQQMMDEIDEGYD
jgi:antitoxin component of MazEF toxin-antitoxin module